MGKKIIASGTFCLMTLMGLSVLAGCGSGSGKTKLTIGFWPETTQTKDIRMYEDWTASFEADYPQYEIVGEPYTYDTATIGSKYMTGTLPMVFQTWFTEPEKLKNNGYIRDITEQLTDFGWLEKMDDGMRDALTFNDKIYGVPRDGYGLGLLLNIKTLGDNGLLPEDVDGNYLLYNEDGSPAYPTTFEEIHDFSETIAEYDETKGIMICSANKNGGWQFNNMAWNYGATFQTQGADGKWTANLDSDQSVEALEWIRQMKADDLLLNNVSVNYDEWYSSIGSKVAMAIVGSDVLHLAQTSGGVSMDDLAFVPMPTGDGTHHYSLYGGTPYVFSSDTTDEEVEGILRFFNYIGRSPTTDESNISAIKVGYEVSLAKNQPVVPKIRPWKNEDYTKVAKEMEDKYITVNMDYYSPFFDTIEEYQHSEEPYYTQEMYEYLDTAIQNVLSTPDTANCKSLLTTANAKLQKQFDDHLNK